MKKYFIVSDIHSQYQMLIDALSKKGFNPNDENHFLIINGDVLDRGNEGKELIIYLESLIKKEKLIGILGNHDVFIKNIINNNWDRERVLFDIHRNGFLKTMQIPFKEPLDAENITESIIENVRDAYLEEFPIFCDWLDELPTMLVCAHHVIVHGFVDFDLDDFEETSERYATWTRGYNLDVPESFNKKLIIGHTPNYHINNQDDIIFDGKKIMIDGGAAMGHQVNVLLLTEEEI